jgi:hypothetical protein
MCDTYRKNLPSIELSGPTLFGEVLKTAIESVRKNLN